jgi:hypothetical protein
VTPGDRTSGVNSSTGPCPDEPDRLSPKQVILGEGTSGRRPAQGLTSEDSRLGDASGPGVDREANVERETNVKREVHDSSSKRPEHREKGAATVRPMRRPNPTGEVRASGGAVTPKEWRRRVAVESRGDTPTGAENETDVVTRAPEAGGGEKHAARGVDTGMEGGGSSRHPHVAETTSRSIRFFDGPRSSGGDGSRGTPIFSVGAGTHD